MEMIDAEFVRSVIWALMAFVAGVCLREWAPNNLGKWLGRAGVAVALIVMICFGNFSVTEKHRQEAKSEHQYRGPRSHHAIADYWRFENAEQF